MIALVQFVPDLLVSDREGQDGPAVIVHTVSLTRLLFLRVQNESAPANFGASGASIAWSLNGLRGILRNSAGMPRSRRM